MILYCIIFVIAFFKTTMPPVMKIAAIIGAVTLTMAFVILCVERIKGLRRGEKERRRK
jgi:vacuolar-type H+-ATPase subunit I/STV1